MKRSISILCAVLIVCLAHNALAQTLSRSYITPFPKNNKYNIVVAGASLAQGTYGGLNKAFKKNSSFKVAVSARIRYASGFINPRGFNWRKDLEAIVDRDKAEVVIVMIGLKELGTIYNKRKAYKVGTPEWKDILGKRITSFLKSMKKKKVAVYWVGLPIMRSPNLNEKMQLLNDVFRTQAFINGVKYIDTWNGFADQFSRYSAFGPDINGKVRRLRTNDGIHLTERGYRKLAHYVEREIIRDIKLAKLERSIPLAGSVEEQNRIRKDKNKKKIPARYSGKQNSDGKDKKRKKTSFFSRFLGGSGKNKKKITGKVIEGVRIIRPPISDIVLSGSNAKNRPGSLNAITGDTIADEIGSGLTALASVTSANALSLKDAKRRIPVKQTPYYRVLVKGEMLKPKPGRADDFAWKK